MDIEYDYENQEVLSIIKDFGENEEIKLKTNERRYQTR